MPDSAADRLAFSDFEKVDIRVGRVIRADPFPEARKPAYKLQIDFGPDIGTRTSSAQLTKHYGAGELAGRLVVAVVNFPPRQIGPFMSQVLTLGVPDAAILCEYTEHFHQSFSIRERIESSRSDPLPPAL